ncbi:lipoprotein N-acyltransferase Lnb domain-containing protein [Ulvibacter litoralis]|uniref:Uncharacterized protein n=1 Tax=Ulvibacter litoralis TaxID=227084 RepID=A0A1G7GWR3_9FLAO|nr:DUF4105 domain-containing protein [Ulvibacter litoralis]GHC59846.1 hypothetical protein GCM10008083_26000 [Ulvibacter litoralis]SDE92555.1 protein of unknown function [Ulvibacter litoralis]
MIKKLLFLFVLSIAFSANAQFIPLSETSEVSILTIGPGDQLYDKFGHSAFRIKDENSNTDIVFNYGVYDFNTPNFYTKFAQGKLLYELGLRDFTSFLESYKRQNRWVKEQTLDLSIAEKQAMFDFLLNNAKTENKKYKYDFFYDNCATKIRDVLQEVLGNKLVFNQEHIIEEYTFRQLIQKNVKANTWGSLGMDIAIGAVVDKKATPIQYQFLPDYVFKGAENAEINKNGTKIALVKDTTVLFEANRGEDTIHFFTSPFFIFGLLALGILFITFKDYKNKTRSRYLDAVLFGFTGLVGILLLLLWFGTDHTATANNYNLLWAFPLSLLFMGAIAKKQPKFWLKKYLFLLVLLFALLTIHWITGVQEFAIGLLPLFIALVVRYVFLIRFTDFKPVEETK